MIKKIDCYKSNIVIKGNVQSLTQASHPHILRGLCIESSHIRANNSREGIITVSCQQGTLVCCGRTVLRSCENVAVLIWNHSLASVVSAFNILLRSASFSIWWHKFSYNNFRNILQKYEVLSITSAQNCITLDLLLKHFLATKPIGLHIPAIILHPI